MRYALLICNDETEAISPDDQSARLAAVGVYAGQLRSSGVMEAGARLRPTSTATTVRVREGDLVIADGPFTETKEQIAGFFLVECEDLDEAIEIAAGIPVAEYGTIEVRPVWEV